jgi:hypothetical protein
VSHHRLPQPPLMTQTGAVYGLELWPARLCCLLRQPWERPWPLSVSTS